MLSARVARLRFVRQSKAPDRGRYANPRWTSNGDDWLEESVTVFEPRIEDERLPLRGPQTRDPADISSLHANALC